MNTGATVRSQHQADNGRAASRAENSETSTHDTAATITQYGCEHEHVGISVRQAELSWPPAVLGPVTISSGRRIVQPTTGMHDGTGSMDDADLHTRVSCARAAMVRPPEAKTAYRIRSASGNGSAAKASCPVSEGHSLPPG